MKGTISNPNNTTSFNGFIFGILLFSMLVSPPILATENNWYQSGLWDSDSTSAIQSWFFGWSEVGLGECGVIEDIHVMIPSPWFPKPNATAIAHGWSITPEGCKSGRGNEHNNASGPNGDYYSNVIEYICDVGYVWNPTSHGCDLCPPEVCPYSQVIISKTLGACPLDFCPANLMGGNPIHLGTGNKFQTEDDYLGAGPFPLEFRRYYNSEPNTVSAHMGLRWRHDYDRILRIIDAITIETVREDGKVYKFTQQAGHWIAEADVVEQLEELEDSQGNTLGWRYTRSNDFIEDYDANGRFIALSQRDGLQQILAYEAPASQGGDDNPATLDLVSDPFGRTLAFSYDNNGRVATLTDPAGGVYTYGYDVLGNLIGVAYPDATPANPNDNPTRYYHYEDPNHPHALTGITDENGNRFATWAYDGAGRAILSEHTDDAERVDLVYNSDGTTTVTDSLGDIRTYHFAVQHGVVKPIQIEGDGPCGQCDGQSQTLEYDANGFIASRADFNGNVTAYIHDARGLETARTEAVGTADERTITTIWHPIFRLPTQITAPGQITTFTYDAAGRLLTREVIAQ